MQRGCRVYILVGGGLDELLSAGKEWPYRSVYSLEDGFWAQDLSRE